MSARVIGTCVVSTSLTSFLTPFVALPLFLWLGEPVWCVVAGVTLALIVHDVVLQIWRRYRREDSQCLNVRVRGTGSSVVLIHGFGASGRFWELVPEKLLRAFRTVVPDLLGFGESPRPHVHYTMTTHLRSLDEAVLPHVPKDEKFHLAGHSQGAIIALEFAARHPERVASLSLFSMPYFISEDEARSVVRENWTGWLMADHPTLAWLACQTVCQRRRLLWPLAWLWSCVSHFPIHVLYDATKHSYQSAMSNFHQVIVAHRVDAAAARVCGGGSGGFPVVVLHGTDDTTVPLASARRFCDRFGPELFVIPEGDHHLFLGGGHVPWDQWLQAIGHEEGVEEEEEDEEQTPLL